MWDDHDSAVVWTLFGIAIPGDWNENWLFPVPWLLLSFPNLLAYWVQHFSSSIFQDLKYLYLKTSWDPTGSAHWGRGEKRCTAPRESAPKPLAAWTAQAGEGTKRRRNQICAFVEYPKTGTTLNAGPAPYRAAGSLSSVDGESTDTPVRGKPNVAGTRGVQSTHSDVCLQRPALPVAGLNWTSKRK